MDGVDVVADHAAGSRAPTLCITGGVDGVNPSAVGRAVAAAAIAGAWYEGMPGIGQLPEIVSPQTTLMLPRSHRKVTR